MSVKSMVFLVHIVVNILGGYRNEEVIIKFDFIE